MIQRYLFLAIATSYVIAMSIWAATDIGTMPRCEPYGWHLPFVVLIILGGSVAMGFLAGRTSIGKTGQQQ